MYMQIQPTVINNILILHRRYTCSDFDPLQLKQLHFYLSIDIKDKTRTAAALSPFGESHHRVDSVIESSLRSKIMH